jgi:hypothetical protein
VNPKKGHAVWCLAIPRTIDTVGSVRLRLPNVLVRAGEIHPPVRDDKERLTVRLWWLPGWAFAAVTMTPALLAVAWLVPGTGMLLAGRLLPVPMVIMFVPLAVALCYFAMRRLPASWPRAGDAARVAGDRTDGGEAGASGGAAQDGVTRNSPTADIPAVRRDVPLAALLAAVAVAAGFGVWQAVYASQQVFAASDPGVYLQYGYWIAAHGTVHIPASPAAFGSTTGLDFATTGFIVSGSSVTPAYLPGLPLVLAGGSWLGGLGGALLMPAVLGGCAVLSFGGLVGRLCGAWWAVAAELVLALCLPEVYTARTPFSEPLVQVLLFGGLCLFADSLVVRRRGFGFGSGLSLGDGLALAALGGLALGLTVLASIGSLATLLPAFPVLALLFAARRPQAAPFGLGLILGIATGLLAGLVLARPYLSTLSAQLHLIGLCAAGFGVATALVAPLAFPGVRSRIRRVCAVRLKYKWFGGEQLVLPSLGFLLAGLALVLPVVVLAALAVRPYLQTLHGQTNPVVIRQVETLQRLERLPVDGLRQYYEESLYWVFWYLGVPALLLACAGAAVLGRRLVRVVLRARPATADADGSPADPAAELAAEATREAITLWLLPFLIIAWSVVTVLWDPSVVPWQPLASRRLVPVVLPGLLLLAVWVSSRLTSRASLLGASRIAVVLVAACCVLALAIPPLVTTLNPGLAAKATTGRYSSGLAKLVSRVRLRGIGTSATYGGSLDAALFLCAAIGGSATVLFVNEATAQSYAPVVRDQCGQPVAALVPAASSTAQLKQAVTAIERTGRHPVLLGPTSASVTLPGTPARPVIVLNTAGDAEELTGPPGGNWPVSYSLWLAAPPTTAG